MDFSNIVGRLITEDPDVFDEGFKDILKAGALGSSIAAGSMLGGSAGAQAPQATAPQAVQLYGDEALEKLGQVPDKYLLALAKRIPSRVSLSFPDDELHKNIEKARMLFNQRDWKDPVIRQKHDKWKKEYLARNLAKLKQGWERIQRGDLSAEQRDVGGDIEHWREYYSDLWKAIQKNAENPEGKAEKSRIMLINAAALLMCYMENGHDIQDLLKP